MGVEKINMPQLGESVTEGTISTWLVEPGDQVNKYDPIAEVMTDKVNAEVPSSFTGVIKELVAEEGETLAVG
ncbi:MAG: biotin/lipoyl-containing protein, partial [Halobacillus sp.]